MLAGYKTYITALLAVAGAVAGYLVGDLTLGAAASIVVNSLLATFVHHAVVNA